MDIGVIATVTDFFLIDTVLLNECTKDFITTGISPKTSSLTIYTLVFKHYYQPTTTDLDLITNYIFPG